jgi:protein-disulfide isomerase
MLTKKIKTIEWLAIIISAILFVLILIKVYQLTVSDKNDNEIYVTVNPLDISFGSDSAKLTVYAYASYHCGYCRLFLSEVLPKLRDEYISKGKVRLVLKLVEFSKNVDRLTEVKTAVCINRYGYYEKLHELLLTNSNVIYTDEFRDMVNHFIDSDPLVAECILGNESLDYILHTRDEFNKFGFTGTPTFVIGGKVYKGYMPYENFRKIIHYHLNR